MTNIENIHNCYGCGVCATVCAQHIIDIELNDDGFYEPRITDVSKCTHCGLCINVCSYCHDDLSLKESKMQSYAAWSRDAGVQKKCSSGGVGFEIGRTLLKHDYKVCGVRYNPDLNRAEHYIATTVEELIPSIGSKYIQSYTVDGFKAIQRGGKYLVTGTPCQIDSFRRYIQKFRCEDNFVLLDFFCHGIPSMWLWMRYTEWAERKVGKLTYVSWRNKITGWHDSWAMAIDGATHGEKVNWHDSYNVLMRGEKSYLNSRLSQGDMFYRLFLSDTCLGKACYDKCKFKYDRSSADIRIGDLWGKMYQCNEDGVSAAVAFTEKGDEILRQCHCELVEHPFEVVAEGQMKKAPVKKQVVVQKFLSLLMNKEKGLNDAINELHKYQKWNNRQKRIRSVLERFLKHIRHIRACYILC